MSTSIWETIAETPWWVFALFFYLMYAAIVATRPSVVQIKTFVIFPIVFVCLTMVNIIFIKQIHFTQICFWIATFSIGSLLGWLQLNFIKIKLLKDENKLQIPGSWSLLIILLVLLTMKYYFGYQITFTTDMLRDPFYQNILISIYGIATGIFVGRWIYVRRLVARSA